MSVDVHKFIQDAGTRLKKLQRADEKTKKRYLVAASAVAMVVVIGLWLVYLNVSLPRVAGIEDTTDVTRNVNFKDRAGDGESFVQVFIRGFGNTTDSIKKQFMSFKERLLQTLSFLDTQVGKANEFSFQGEEIDFVFEGEDPIPPTPLP